MKNYQLTKKGGVIRLSDSLQIPPDVNNCDYQHYLEWVAQGNTAIPYVEPVINEEHLNG